MLLEISEGQVTETGQAKMPSDVACLDITPFAMVSQCNSLLPGPLHHRTLTSFKSSMLKPDQCCAFTGTLSHC